MIPVGAGAFRRRFQRNVARQHHDGDATVKHRFTHGDRQYLRDLLRGGNQLAIVAAFAKQLLWVGLLKVAAADFAGRNVGGDSQNRDVITVAIEQTVNQMQVARPA